MCNSQWQIVFYFFIFTQIVCHTSTAVYFLYIIINSNALTHKLARDVTICMDHMDPAPGSGRDYWNIARPSATARPRRGKRLFLQ